MKSFEVLNSFAQDVWALLVAEYATWERYFGTRAIDDLEVAIPAPPGSNAGHLVIFTVEAKDLWLRFDAPYMCYPIDDLNEMLSVIKSLLKEDVCMVVTTEDGKWVETTLITRGGDIPLGLNQMAQFLSWSGGQDKTKVGPRK